MAVLLCDRMYCYTSLGALILITRMGQMWWCLESAQQREIWIMTMTPWSLSFLQVGIGFVLQRTFSAFLIAAAVTCSIGHRGECFSLAGKKVIVHLSVFCPHLLLFYYKKFNFFSIDVYVNWGRGILYPLLPLH